MPITGDGGSPFNSAWFVGRSRGGRAQPREIVNVAVSPAYAAVWQDFFFPASGPAAQTLSPALFVNTNTFYSATVTATRALTPALYTNINVFYSATIAATRSLTPALYTNTNTFYSATVTATKILTPAIYTNTNVLYSPTVTVGTSILPPRYDNANIFYSATVTRGANTLTPVRYDNSNTFYSATVSQPNGNQNIIAPRVNNSNTFFSAVLTGGSQPQPIITTGSIVKPRRKFKPSILLDVEKKPEPAINAVIALEMVQAQSKVLAPSVSGTIIINADVRMAEFKSSSRIMSISAASSWNDPTDDEIIAIFALLE